MRVYLSMTKNKELIPFNYQHLLTSVIHKWIGKDNDVHGQENIISFSWLQNTKAENMGLNLKYDSFFFISAADDDLIRKIVKGVIDNPNMFCGIVVKDIQIAKTPSFSVETRFVMASPVLLKWKEGDNIRHVTIEDTDFEEKLNINFRNKLKKAGIPFDGMEICIDSSSTYKRTKKITYKRIENRASLVPIIIKGTQEQIEYAWNVGLGNSTGIGFGALK